MDLKWVTEGKLNMDNNIKKIEFTFSDSSETVEFFVVEQTMLNGVNYLLVTDSEEEETDAYILKNISTQDNEALYEMVEDENELDAVGSVFAELLEDIDIQ